jgi:hypothetical protein
MQRSQDAKKEIQFRTLVFFASFAALRETLLLPLEDFGYAFLV